MPGLRGMTMDDQVALGAAAERARQQASPQPHSVISTQYSVLLGDRAWLVLLAATALAMLVALYAIFVYAPTERVMGHVQRIFYVHVSLAWLSYLAFLVVFVCSVVY